ncbi:MAG: DMT family transporter [Thermoproteota archaeon]
MKSRSWFLFLVMVLLWGTNWSVMKLGLLIAPPFAFVSNRLLFSSLALLLVLIFVRPRVPIDRNLIGNILSYSLVTTVSFAATNLGLTSYSSGTGAVLTYTQPLFVFVLALFFLREKISKRKVFGVIIGFFGILLLFLRDGSQLISLSAAFLLLGAFLWAVGTVFYKLRLLNVDATFVNFVQASITFLVLFFISILTEPVQPPWNLQYLSIAAYAGIGASATGMTIWLHLLKEEKASSLSGSSLIVPVIALLFGFLLMNEPLDARSFAGSALVLFGVYLVNRKA